METQKLKHFQVLNLDSNHKFSKKSPQNCMFKLKNEVIKCSPKSSFMGKNKEIYFFKKKKKKFHKTTQKKLHRRTIEVFVGYFGYVSQKIQSINMKEDTSTNRNGCLHLFSTLKRYGNLYAK